MSLLHIVLFEPEIPQNTGNIARTCAAIGAALHLIEPMGFSVSQKEVRRAGLDYWHLVPVSTYASWEAFSSERNSADPGWFERAYFFSTKGASRYDAPAYPSGAYLVFGKETAGLPLALREAAGPRLLRIPIREEARSLNLSNAAAVCAFEVMRQWDFRGLHTADESAEEPGKGMA